MFPGKTPSSGRPGYSMEIEKSRPFSVSNCADKAAAAARRLCAARAERRALAHKREQKSLEDVVNHGRHFVRRAVGEINFRNPFD